MDEAIYKERKIKGMKKFISLFLVITIVTSLFAGISFALTDTSVSADEVEIIEVSVKKMWDDYSNFDNIRPKKVNVTLTKNGVSVITVSLNEDNNWYYKYNAPVERYDDTGNEYEYTWECDEIDGYSRYVDLLDNMAIITDVHHITTNDNDAVTLQKLDENNDFLDECKLRVLDSTTNELFSWISGNPESITINDDTLAVTMDENGSVIVKGLPAGEYTYEEVLPKAGYTSATSKKFKVEKNAYEYTYNWYTSLEAAVADSNNLTMENADCYRDDENVEAGLIIVNDVAHLIMLKDVSDASAFGLDQNTVFDLETNTLSFASANGLQYCSDLKMLDGTIELKNVSRGINGLVSATYQSAGKLYMDSVNVNHTSNVSGSRTINTYALDTKIENCVFTINYSAGGYGLMFANTAGKAVFKNNIISSKNTGASTIYSFNSTLKTLEFDNNVVNTVSGKVSYGVNASGTILNIKSGEFNTTSSGGNAISIYASNKSSITVDYMKSFAKSTEASGWTQGIYIGGTGSSCTINDCYIESVGTKYNNVGLYIGSGADVKVYGGYFYGMPVPSSSNNDSYGNGIRNLGICFIEEKDNKTVTVSGGHSGIQSDYGSTLIINSGTFESPNHGGLYLCNGVTGYAEINGGTFHNNYFDYDESVVGDYNDTGIHNFGSLYVGHPNKSGQAAWSIDIKNAEISGSATWGLVLRGDADFVPATVNLYNTNVSGNKADIWVSNYSTIGTYDCYVHLYEGTTLVHNMVFDQYGLNHNESRVIDHREGTEEFETITE